MSIKDFIDEIRYCGISEIPSFEKEQFQSHVNSLLQRAICLRDEDLADLCLAVIAEPDNQMMIEELLDYIEERGEPK